MQTVDVAGAESEVFARTIDLFDRHLKISTQDGLRLGGGTALAMLWKHRRSTDFDFAMPDKVLRSRLVEGQEGLKAELKGLKEQGQIRGWRVWGTGLTWEWANGSEISISRHKQDHSEPQHAESTTGIALSPVFDILRGKLIGRVLTSFRLVIRDAYDLMVSYREEPQLFQKLINDALERTDMLPALVEHIHNTKKKIIVGRPLIDADDSKLAHDPWGRFADIVGKMRMLENHEQTIQDAEITSPWAR